MVNLKAKGFTLLEMLVVMMLVTMLTTLIFQGYAQVASIVNNLTARSNQGVKATLQINWYHSILSHIINYQTFNDSDIVFENSLIQAVTTEPLLGRPGLPTLFKLELMSENGSVYLMYAEGKEKPMQIGEWSSERAKFSYSDNLKKWNSSWKQKKSKLYSLPKAIMIEIGDKEQKITYYSGLTSFNYDGPVKFIP